ncbi:MAG: hypothetical protein PWQ57_339 [Desulfovibrionales bacterium]|nr:hypothetical protein [Desulfovibrionales bacterium]
MHIVSPYERMRLSRRTILHGAIGAVVIVERSVDQQQVDIVRFSDFPTGVANGCFRIRRPACAGCLRQNDSPSSVPDADHRI